MRALTTLPAIFFLSVFFISEDAFSQTKDERKVSAKTLDVGEYESTENEEAKKYYDQGNEMLMKQDYKEAVKLYKKAIEADPKFVEAYDNLALSYRRLGNFDDAIANYKKSIALYPEGKMAHTNLGLIYGIQKKYKEAVKEYETVQKLEPEDAEGYYGTIQLYIDQQMYDKAIEAAKKTLEIYEATNDPYLRDAQYLLGISYYLNKDTKNAKIYLTQAKASGVKVPQQLIDELKIK